MGTTPQGFCWTRSGTGSHVRGLPGFGSSEVHHSIRSGRYSTAVQVWPLASHILSPASTRSWSVGSVSTITWSGSSTVMRGVAGSARFGPTITGHSPTDSTLRCAVSERASSRFACQIRHASSDPASSPSMTTASTAMRCAGISTMGLA